MADILGTRQEPPHPVIPEEEVSLPVLSQFLDAAEMAYEYAPEGDDAYLYVRRGVALPLWVRIDAECRYVELHTYVNIDGRIAGQFKMANALNMDAKLVQFHIDGTRLYGYSWMTIAGGLDSRQFVSVLREFSVACRVGADLLVSKIESDGQWRH